MSRAIAGVKVAGLTLVAALGFNAVIALGAARASASPVNTAAPTISGEAEEGQMLTASPGSWSGTEPIAYTYQWQRCDALGEACELIVRPEEVEEESYLLTAGDVGRTIRVAVTATNAEGSASATSAPTALVTVSSPVNTGGASGSVSKVINWIPWRQPLGSLLSPLTNTFGSSSTTENASRPSCKVFEEYWHHLNANGECIRYEVPVTYHGGEVIKEPKLYLILWGSNWYSEKDTRWRRALRSTLWGMNTEWGFDTTYQRILHQYWDEHEWETERHQISENVTVGGEYVYEGEKDPWRLSFTKIEKEINYAIEANKWPREENNSIFMLMEPTGARYEKAFVKGTEANWRGKHMKGWCAFHDYDRRGDVYGFVPNLDNPHFYEGCVESSETTVQHAETEQASHEYMEAVSDPLVGGGWYNNEEYGAEIADICDKGPEKVNEPLDIYVSAVWGNHEKECVIKDPPEPAPAPPTATTEPATAIQETQATLHGTVNPNGGPEPHYRFEYGTTASYGSSTPEEGAGYGTTAVPVSSTVTGLSPHTTYHYRLVASTWAGTSYGVDETFWTPSRPSATTEGATNATESEATLNATVNPWGQETKYHFEYGTTASYGSSTADASAGSSVGNVAVSQTITGLQQKTTYHYRIVASNATGTTDGQDQTFITPGPPSASTEGASNVSETEATLNGTVDPWGAEAKYRFEYGPTTLYGSSTPEASAGSGFANVAVSQTVSGLLPGVTYHYRLIASNRYGAADGQDQTFTTSTPSLAAWHTQVSGMTISPLYGVSCPTTSDCWAVGERGTIISTHSPL